LYDNSSRFIQAKNESAGIEQNEETLKKWKAFKKDCHLLELAKDGEFCNF